MIAHKTDRAILPRHCEAKENTIEIQLFCFISFDGSTDGIYIMDFLNDAATVEMNGYTVEYNEMSSDEAAADGLTMGSNLDYHGWAKFIHNGYAYYIATHSDNPDFFELTLEQMLK